MAEESNTEAFVYTEGAVVPEDVVRVRVHPSVTIIPETTFQQQGKLEDVELCDGLLEIGGHAFSQCKALKRISIPSTVTTIYYNAFSCCSHLEDVVLGDGLLEIGSYAFHKCNSLKRISVPPSVNDIGENAFSYCLKLEELELFGGLQTIGKQAFYRCTSLKNFTIPNTVRRIGSLAFCHVFQLRHLHLPESIESVGSYPFSYNKCPNCRIPPSFTRITSHFIGDCQSMFSIELPEGITDIEVNAFSQNHFLRNIALPLNVQKGSHVGAFYDVFNRCTNLQQLYGTTDRWSFQDDGSDDRIINALQHRFDNLPIHKLIYYQSYTSITVDELNKATNMRSNQSRSLRSKLDPTGSQQDCLGMTPLHILACSTVQNIDLYKVLIEKYPENLVTKDRWGAIPLLYVLWGNAPDEIIQFFAESYQSRHPKYELNWTKIVEQLCLGNAAISSIQRLLDVQQDSPHQNIDWHTIIQKAATNQTPIVQADIFGFLAENSYSKRIDAIGIKQWRDDLTLEIEEYMLFENGQNSYLISHSFPKRKRWFDSFNSKIAEYEARYQELKEATTILELVLWKNKISEASISKQVVESGKKMKFDESAIREQSRISCGASIIISHVLPYLLSVQTKSILDEVKKGLY